MYASHVMMLHSNALIRDFIHFSITSTTYIGQYLYSDTFELYTSHIAILHDIYRIAPNFCSRKFL